jgi:RND family efflux transporter MFP subunit
MTHKKMDTEKPQPAAETAPAAKPRRRFGWIIIAVVCLMAAGIVALASLRGNTGPSTDEKKTVTVGVVRVTREDIFNEEKIPGEFRAYVEVDVHAKVSGYVDQMNVDFGDRVKDGQLLATLEVPELHDELNNARAALQRAGADYTNYHLIYTRLNGVNDQHPNLIAPQELDTARSKDDTAAAAVAAAKADVARYETLVKYTQITAPFDGVVTHRYADKGSLIQAATGSDTQTMPLVRVSDNFHLRMDFPVSVKYVKDVQMGKPVSVRVDSLDGKTFTGKITRFTQRVNDDTRTMMTEIEVANPDLEIVPGMYATVIWKVEQRPQVLVLPTQAVGGGNESSVYVVNANHEIETRPVKLGLEMPEKYEIVSGLQENDLVMVGNRAFVHPGQKVEVKLIDQPVIP